MTVFGDIVKALQVTSEALHGGEGSGGAKCPSPHPLRWPAPRQRTAKNKAEVLKGNCISRPLAQAKLGTQNLGNTTAELELFPYKLV